MHEMSLCASVVQTLESQAVAQGYTRVRTVWLEVGQLAGVEVAALRFCFPAVALGTLAESARLEILEIPGRGKCRGCGTETPLAEWPQPCPDCGGWQLDIVDGEQMRIKELEVE